jgi:autotransporter-associated beta strand protein
MNYLSRLTLTLIATSLCVFAWTPLHAVDLYWDSNGTTAGAGATPNGTWGVNSFWNTTAAGTAGTFSTGMTQADQGFFSAGTDAINPYTVTVSGTQATGNLQFQEGTPTLTGGTIALGAAKTLTAAATLNGTATIASALTVNTTAATTLRLTANDGPAATDLLITGPISATSANTYQLRFEGAGNTRIEGAISGHGGTLGSSGWTGTVTISGNQDLGSSQVNLTIAGNKLVMGDTTSDVQSWTGTTTVSASSSLLTIRSTASSGIVNLRGAGGTLDVVGDFTAAGFTFGSNGINDSTQAGIMKLSGGNATFSGTGGQITIYGTGSKIIGGAASYGTLTMNQTTALTLTDNVTLGGAGTNENNFNLVKAGANTLTLSGVNTFAGTTTINGGTLALANQNAIQNSTLVMTGGGNVSFSSAEVANAFTLGGLSASSNGSGYNIALANNSPTAIALTVGNNNASTTYAGILSGAGSLVKTGTGTLTLSGNNSYSGTTSINSGTLLIDAGGRLGSGSYAAAITNNGALVYSGTNNQTLSGTLSGSGFLTQNGSGVLTLANSNTYSGGTSLLSGSIQITNANSLGTTGNLSFGGGTLQYGAGITTDLSSRIHNSSSAIAIDTNGQNVTFASALGASNVGGLTKSGVGTLVLSGANTFTGTTTISTGILNIQNSDALGSTASGTTLSSGAALQLQGGLTIGAEALTLAGTGISTDGALRNISGANSLAGEITLAAATRINSDSGSLTLSGGISGSQNLTLGGSGNTTITGAIATSTGTLTKDGAGTLVLSGANTFTGTTTISAGILNIQNSDALGSTASGITVSSGAALQIQGGISVGAEALTLSGTGVSTDGALRNISGANSLAGDITLNAATRINSDSGSLTLNGGISGTQNLTIGGSGNTTLAGSIATSTGTLTKDGSGTLTLSGANSFTGAVTIQNGALQLDGGDNRLLANKTITIGSVSNSAKLILGGTSSVNQTLASLSFSGLGGSIVGGSSSASSLHYNSASSLTLNGTVFGGAGLNENNLALVKSGGGALTLNGTNTYTGGTTLTNGNTELRADGALGNGNLTFNATATSRLRLNGTNQTITGLTILGSTASVIENQGGGNGTLTIQIANGQTSSSASNFSFRDQSAGAGTLALVKTGEGTLDFSIFSAMTYSGGLTVNGGTFAYTNQMTNTAALGSGTLVLGGGSLSYAGSSAVTVSKNITLSDASSSTLNNAAGTLTYSGVISGSGSLIKSGAGNATLSGANTFTGSTTLNAGTLTLANQNAIQNSTLVMTGGGNVSFSSAVVANAFTLGGLSASSAGSGYNIALTNNASSAIALTVGNNNASTTYAGALSGSGSLVKTGSGTLSLSGANTFTGTTTINSGTLQAAAADAVGGTTVIDVNGGSFLVTTANAVNDNAAINLNGGTLAVSGTFDETVGLLTLSANSVIDLNGFSGTLRFGGVGSWAASANLQIWNWNGINQYDTAVGDGANNRHVVFTSDSGLSTYLDRISFYSGSGSGFAGTGFAEGFTGSGGGTEIIAVPETETYFYAVALLTGVVIQYLRRRAKQKSSEGHQPAFATRAAARQRDRLPG